MNKSINILKAIQFISKHKLNTSKIKSDIIYNNCIKKFAERQSADEKMAFESNCSGISSCDDCILKNTRPLNKTSKDNISIKCAACFEAENYVKAENYFIYLNINQIMYKLWKQIEEYRDIIVDEDL